MINLEYLGSFTIKEGCLTFSQNPNTIAILDFSNNSIAEKIKYESLSPGLAEIMITELSKVHSLKLVERQKIKSLIQEIQLAQSGMVDESTSIKVGKLLGAHYLVFGSYMVAFNKKIRVDVRIVEVETGLTIEAEGITDKVDDIFKIIQKLNEKIIDNLKISLTKEEKKDLKKCSASLSEVAYFSRGIKYEDENNIKMAKAMYIKALKLNNDFEPAKKRLNRLINE